MKKKKTFQREGLVSHGAKLLQVPDHCAFFLPGTQYKAEINNKF